MASILLLGSKQKAHDFLDDYVAHCRIAPYDIEKFEDVKIDDVRGIKKKLAFKKNDNRLFFLSGEITIEAQNALLKSVEEHSLSTHFIFSAERDEMLLPTIRSRCRVVSLGRNTDVDVEKQDFLAQILSDGKPDWIVIDSLVTHVTELSADSLVFMMRRYMLDNLDDVGLLRSFYQSYKRMFALLPLQKNNNVSIRTFVEKTFV